MSSPPAAEPPLGRVAFVGAGPGDPGLLTARALELIALADVILYDRLIPDEALAGARADAELRYVGKQGGGAFVPQEETEALMLERARGGALVVRLKGGDPFVFGRGGEEALALRAAGIAFEVVPGITAGIAAPRLRRHPGDPTRTGQCCCSDHRARGSGEARERRLTGARLPPSRERSCSTWACARCRR